MASRSSVRTKQRQKRLERKRGAPISAAGDELQLSRAVRTLVERHDARDYTRAKAPPRESPFGRSQTLKSERLRHPRNTFVVAIGPVVSTMRVYAV